MNADQQSNPLAPFRKYFLLIIALLAINTVMNGYWIFENFEENKWKTTDHEKLWELMDQNRHEEALDFAEKSLADNPVDDQMMWGKAVSLYYLERWDESIAEFERIIEFRPSWTEHVNDYLEIARARRGGTE